MASRQGGPAVDEMAGIESLPEPAAYAATVRRTTVDADSPPYGRTPADPPTRNPASYAQTDHFYDRLRQQGRYITLTTVSKAIEYGQLRWNSTDGWRFALTEDGVRFIVVVTDTETPSPVVVTGWTEIADVDAARRSNRWSENDIETIRLRSKLSTHYDQQIPDHIRPRAITRAFQIGGHRVKTALGQASVRCTECGKTFRSKAALCEVACSAP